MVGASASGDRCLSGGRHFVVGIVGVDIEEEGSKGIGRLGGGGVGVGVGGGGAAAAAAAAEEAVGGGGAPLMWFRSEFGTEK